MVCRIYIFFFEIGSGEEAYYCLWIKQRSANILEFQIGVQTARNASMHICDDSNFDENNWLTQGRLDQNLVVSPCPVNGGFLGIIPDTTGLCAKLSSDCSQPDLMYYQVSDCDEHQVYEGMIM